MNICHIITRMILGGAQENTLLTVIGLLARGHRVTLISGPPIGPEGQLLDRAYAAGVPLMLVPEMRREINPWRDWVSFTKLLAALRRIRPDVVHTHSSKAGILGRWAASLLGVPVVVHTIHGLPFHRFQHALLNLPAIFLERCAATVTDKLISVAEAMTCQALEAGVGKPHQFVTIYSGMEVEPFLANQPRGEEVRKELSIPADVPVVGKISRLQPLKGHRYLIQAMPGVIKKFPRVIFLFVGAGILENRLRTQARSLGVDRHIRFLGLVAPERIPELIKAMDLVVHVSLREGLARVLPQALISGKPVVSYDVDGAREVVIPDRTGILVSPRAVEELAEAVTKVLSLPGRGRQMGQQGRKLFAPQFRWQRMVEKVEALYCELVGEQGQASPGSDE